MNIKLTSISSITREPMWAVQCDRCGKQAPSGIDAGVASERARKEGFITRSNGLEEPMLWICPDCEKPNLVEVTAKLDR